MKPFNSDPTKPRDIWIRTRQHTCFHLRDSRYALPHVVSVCGEPFPAAEMPFELYHGSQIAPFGACRMCLEKAGIAA